MTRLGISLAMAGSQRSSEIQCGEPGATDIHACEANQLGQESELLRYMHDIPCTESGASAHPAQQALRLSTIRA